MQPQPPDRRRRSAFARAAAGLARVVRTITHPAVVIIVGVAIVGISREHAVLPGLAGCRYVWKQLAAEACYSERFDALVRDDGIDDALVQVARRARKDETLANVCHVAWHPVGERAGRDAAGGKGKPTPGNGRTDNCSLGYFHGYIIGYLSELDAVTPASVRTAARVCGLQRRDVYGEECVHALGHLFVRRAGMERTVEACALLTADATGMPSDRLARRECYYGGYMERALLDEQTGQSKPRDGCRAEPAQARAICYRYLATHIVAVGGDADDAARVCERARTGNRLDCVRGFELQFSDRCEALTRLRGMCERTRRQRRDGVLPKGFDAR